MHSQFSKLYFIVHLVCPWLCLLPSLCTEVCACQPGLTTTHSGRVWRVFSSPSFAPLRAPCVKPSRFWHSSIPRRVQRYSISAADLAVTPWSLRAVASRSRAWTARDSTLRRHGLRRDARG